MLKIFLYNFIIFYLGFQLEANCQTELLYNREFFTASLTYCKLSLSHHNTYPITGGYSPTPWVSDKSYGVGYGAYIYFSTKNKIQPGIIYKISLKLKIFDSYNYSDYFKSHFGIAFTKNLKTDEYEIWNEKIYHLDSLFTDSIMQVEFNFRALCKPNYLVIGVFQNDDEFTQKPCAFCFYKYELHELSVSKQFENDSNFEYVCNDFVLRKPNRVVSDKIDTSIYFSLNDHTIDETYDSLFPELKKLVSDQDVLILNSYTDKSGDKNLELGKSRVESVLAKLIEVGIDTNQMISQIHGEKYSTKEINREDRKVNIKKSEDKLFQKYYSEAMNALNNNDDKTAWKNLLLWLKNVTKNSAIFSLFDCWTIETKNFKLKKRLEERIKDRFYKNNTMSFTLDSLWCEDQRFRAIKHYTVLNHSINITISNCDYIFDSTHQQILEDKVVFIFNKMGFPNKEKYGMRGNMALPYIIIHSDNLEYQKQFLPLFQKAAEDKEISWEMFALLWDKISLKEKGYQRYGTQFEMDKMGAVIGVYKLENESKVNEWRKQVGLDPLSD